MSKSQRRTVRKPATKFSHLQKKIQKQQVPVKKPKGNDPCSIQDGHWLASGL